MSIIKPFRALRPSRQHAEAVASPPYDVLNSAEARARVAGNPQSFLYVNKPEISLPEDVDLYSQQVYKQAGINLQKLRDERALLQDSEPCLYVYKQIMGKHEQVGIVAAASVEEYENGLIKKHEFTRPVKEDDRVNHMVSLNAQVGPVFLTYKAQDTIDDLVNEVMQQEPEYDFNSDDIQHTFWVVSSDEVSRQLVEAFARVDALYVADGHHRSAAAMRVKQMRQKDNPGHTGEESYNFFLTVIFPDNQMQILDYNRLVQDLNGHGKEEFLAAIEQNFSIAEVADKDVAKPTAGRKFGMYLDGQWYSLTAREGTFDPNDPVERLDVSILQKNLLTPLLGINNPRKDKRIDFVGGIRGLGELERRTADGSWKVAFALFPTSIEDLMAIADAGEVMPPKSTWFEPKLKSGLVSHLLD
ncbi:MAG: DUF1015 domain-containing protein [Calditrichia bacterium]